MIGMAGMISGLCVIAGGEIGGLFGVKEQGYEIGCFLSVVIMGAAVLLNQQLRQGGRDRDRHRNRNRNRV